MSCNYCLNFTPPYCAAWGTEVPADWIKVGCDRFEVDSGWRDERVGIRMDSELGEKLSCGAFERDLPVVKAYAWCLSHLPLSEGRAVRIRMEDVASDCRMELKIAKEAMEILYQEGTLKIVQDKKVALFWLNIYTNG